MNIIMQIINESSLYFAEKLNSVDPELNKLVISFFLVNAVVALTMFVYSRYSTDFKRLSTKGLSHEYIRLKSIVEFGVNYKVMFIFIITQLVLLTFVFVDRGRILASDYGDIVGVSTIVFLISLIAIRNSYKDKIRELVMLKKGEIVFDFQFKVLGYMLNKPLEILIILLAGYLNFKYLGNSVQVYLLSLIPIAYYYLLKTERNYTRESLISGYKVLGAICIIMQCFRLFEFIIEFSSVIQVFTQFHTFLAALFAVALVIQLGLSILNFPRFISSTKMKDAKDTRDTISA